MWKGTDRVRQKRGRSLRKYSKNKLGMHIFQINPAKGRIWHTFAVATSRKTLTCRR